MKTPRIALLLGVLSVSALAIVNDDLFTGGTQEKPQPKSKPDPSASEWDRLLEAAEGAALDIPETAQSEEQERLRRREWWKKNAFDAAIAQSRGRPDEKEARDFFEEMIPWFSNTGFPPYDQKTAKRCMEIAGGTVRRPALDFVAARFLILHKREADGVKLIRTVADAPADAGIPSLMRVLAQADVLHWCDANDRPAVRAAEELFYELIGKHLAEPCDDDEAEIILANHLSAPISQVWKGREARCFEAYKNSKLPDWARFTLGGTFEVWLGSGKIAPGQEKMNEQFNQRHERARELLIESWRLHPQSSWAARGMVEVVRRGHGGEGDSLRLWNDRVLASSCDYTFAADKLFHNDLHSGGRGYEEMLAYGRACLETKRYDSGLPTMFNRAVSHIASDLTDWRSIYRSPKLGALLLDTREKCLAGAKTDRIRLLHLSYLFYESWACGDYARAHKALLMLPISETGDRTIDYDVRTLCHRLNIDVALPRQDLLVRLSPAREVYEKGITELAVGHPGEARAHFENALKTAGDEPAKYLGAQIALAKFQERFDGGEWAAVPLDQRMLWHYSEGGMEWRAEEKKARLTSTWDFGKILFRGALGDSYEVRGHFQPQRLGEKKRTAGISIFCGYSPDTFGRHIMNWWVGRVDLNSSTKMTMDFDQMFGANTNLKKEVAYTSDNPFLMRREKGHITFVCGGKRIDADIPADAPSGPGAFGVGVIVSPGFGYTDVWDFEARKLTPVNRVEDPLVTLGSVAIKQPKFAPVISGKPEEMAAKVKALVAGSRWEWFDKPDFSGEAHWLELYKDGTARTSWGTGHTWDIKPPNILHVFQPNDSRHFYFDMDVANKTGVKSASLDKGGKNSIHYEKAINVIPPASVAPGTGSMTLYVSGCNNSTLVINGKEEKKFGRDNAAKLPFQLHEGDIIAVRLGDQLDRNSLWFACISPRGELLFETDERWKCYIPADKENWWNIKAPKEQKPVRFAPDSQSSVANVKRAAAKTPLAPDARPVRGDISDDPKAVFIYRIVTKADLTAKQALGQASENPGTPAASAQTEQQKWIATTDAQWQATFRREVSEPHDAEMGQLKIQFLTMLDEAMAKAIKAADLAGAVALRDERRRFNDTRLVPEQDESGVAAPVKEVRAALRSLLAEAEKGRTGRATALLAKYDQVLMLAQALLVQSERLDDAKRVTAKRTEVAAAWAASPAVATPKPAVAPAKTTATAGLSVTKSELATTERPFENSFGMRFVPVPITGGPTDGKRVLFSIWETRVQDYEVFATVTKTMWPSPPFAQEPAHPAVNVSWDEAQIFCAWLTELERRAGRLAATESYRLPADHEWSCLVGLEKLEDAAQPPAAKDNALTDLFPWGTGERPFGFGNYKGVEETGDSSEKKPRFMDTFQNTAPVGSFAPDRFGIFDVGGNVWEWCQDLFEPGKNMRFVRGGSFTTSDQKHLPAANRWPNAPGSRNTDRGFRLVLVTGEIIPPPPVPAVAVAKDNKPAAKPQPQAAVAVVEADVGKSLAGTWRFSWDKNGWNEPREFKADGTFTVTADGKGTRTGKWGVSGNKVIVTYPDGGKDEMVLPLDPNGTKVIGKRNREMKAVKEK